ncbi:MAG: hypothetical protein RI922_1578 [Bacteroidota bacterium]|jgi:hypothetical protein
MKIYIVFILSFVVSTGWAQSENYGLVYQVYNTTIYNPLDSAIFYEINDSTLVRLAKSNSATCYVENVGDDYLKDESINMTGTTINTAESLFIFIGASKMHQLSLTDGTVLSSVDLINPLVQPSDPVYFNNFIFNQSDTTIYGLSTRQNSAGDFGNYFASVNPYSGVVTEISTNSISQSILMAGATIDPYQMVYYFANDSAMVGIDLYNGSIYSNNTINFPPNFTQFGNFAYSCVNNTIYGLATREYTTLVPDPFSPGNFINQFDSTKLFLGTVDPTTGQVSVVGANPIDCTNAYVMNSGGAIDPSTMMYYFNDGEKYIGVSLSTGLVESSCIETFEDGQQFILFRNNTNCVGASSIRLNPLSIPTLAAVNYRISPNPSSGVIYIQSDKDVIETIDILTLSGQSMYQESSINSSIKSIDSSFLAKGIYYLKINNSTIEKIIVN